MTAGLDGLAELGDKRGFDVALKIATDTNQSRTMRGNALEVIASTGKGDPRAYPLIFDQFKKAFDANDIQSIVNSLNALVHIADPRGQEAFDMLKTKYKDNPGALNFISNFESQFKAAIRK